MKTLTGTTSRARSRHANKTATKKSSPKKSVPTKPAKKAALAKPAKKAALAKKKSAGKPSSKPIKNGATKRRPREEKTNGGAITKPRVPRKAKKRLKKSVAARAVARAEALLQAEKDRAREKLERHREKLRSKKAREKERLQRAQAEKKSREKEAKARARAEVAAAKARLREDARLEKERARKEKLAERERVAQEKAGIRAAREAEKRSLAQARDAARAAQRDARARKLRERKEAQQAAALEKEHVKRERELAKQAALQSKAQAREQKAREKEEAKAARMKAQEEARKRKADEREEARAARERAKVEEAAHKKARAEAKKREKARLKEVEADLKENQKRQEKRLTVGIAELTTHLIDLLSCREGVSIVRNERGPSLPSEELGSRAEDVPPEVLAWYRAVGPIDFGWELDPEANRHNHISGSLRVPPLDELAWTPRGRYLLAPGEGASERQWTSLEEYLLRGATTLFTWDHSETALRALAASAVPRFTPASVILEKLEGKGLSEKSSRAIAKLMGAEAFVLIHETETDEGRRRRDIRRSAPEQTEVNRSLLEALSEGPPVEKREWQVAAEKHLRFLEGGGGGGTFRTSVSRGLPFASYIKVPPDELSGQADFSGENLTRIRARGLRLSYANFCGARGTDASLSGCDLTQSCFAYGHFERVNFQGADLSGCDFSGARLAGADFRKALLKETSFERADLSGANFAGATTSGTKFGGANVKGIRY